MKRLIFGLLGLCLAFGLQAQMLNEPETQTPLDGIVDYSHLQQKRALEYPPVRAADVLWEKRIWRELDTREKMNLPFRYEKAPLFSILLKGIEEGELEVYSPENDQFSLPLSYDELAKSLYKVDTIPVFDPITYIETYQIVQNDVDPQDVVRYRIKEVWYFDSKYAALRVKILGIAPIIQEFDDNGNFRFERPLFWVYYPDARDFLAQHAIYNNGNDKPTMSWEDLLEMRFFASHITKESNVFDKRLEDTYSGKELLQEADKIRMEIFNYEHDMWSY